MLNSEHVGEPAPGSVDPVLSRNHSHPAHLPWLGLIMVASILWARGSPNHLRPQGREGAVEKLARFCQVLEEALVLAHKDLDRLILARELMSRVTDKTRSNSKLPKLVELFLFARW